MMLAFDEKRLFYLIRGSEVVAHCDGKPMSLEKFIEMADTMSENGDIIVTRVVVLGRRGNQSETKLTPTKGSARLRSKI